MYCSTCGAEMPGELNYCNRCGASLNTAANLAAPAIAPMSFTKLVIIMGSIFVVGLGIIFASVGEMMRKGISEPAVVWLTMFGLMTLFGLSVMLIRLWSKIAVAPTLPPPQRIPREPQRLYETPRQAQLSPRPASFASVTENTTRTFDPVYRNTAEVEGKGPGKVAEN